jgi:hypothetical protein
MPLRYGEGEGAALQLHMLKLLHCWRWRFGVQWVAFDLYEKYAYERSS